MLPLHFQEHVKGISAEQLEKLFEVTRLGGRKGDKIRRAFANSPLVCLAMEGDELVGSARAITDGEYHAFIYDVAVHPRHQGRGVGRHLMENLLGRLRVWRVMLVAAEGVQPFYEKLGFQPHADAMARLDRTHLFDPESGLRPMPPGADRTV
jgi:aralkylamine N-acetyltransferase